MLQLGVRRDCTAALSLFSRYTHTNRGPGPSSSRPPPPRKWPKHDGRAPAGVKAAEILKRKLGVTFQDPEVLLGALTYPGPLITHHNHLQDPRALPGPAALHALGRATLQLVAVDYLREQHPNLSRDMIRTATTALTTGRHVTEVLLRAGVIQYTRYEVEWTVERSDPFAKLNRQFAVEGPSKPSDGWRRVLLPFHQERIVHGLIGGVKYEHGLEAARGFAEREIFNSVNIPEHIHRTHHQKPADALTKMCKQRGYHFPVYKVTSLGPDRVEARVYALNVFLATGYGATHEDARTAAAQSALYWFYASGSSEILPYVKDLARIAGEDF